MFSSLMYGRTMTREEILTHSLPYLYALNEEFMNIRIIESGGNPYKKDDDQTENYENENHTDKHVSSKVAAAALNAALRS